MDIRRVSARSSWRRTALAGLAAAAVAAVGVSGTAHAEPAPVPVTVKGTDKLDLSLSGGNVDPTEHNVEIRVEGPGAYDPDVEPNPDPIPSEGYSITIDATELEGFADVELPSDCAPDGLVAVCTSDSLYAGDVLNPNYDLRVEVTDASKAGDFGKIKVTGQGEGLTFNEHTVDVLIGGPELRMKQLPAEPAGFAAGDTYTAPLGFRNAGSMAADGVVLRFAGSRGLSFPGTYENCEYAEESKDEPIHYRKVVLCSFEGDFAPGKAWELSEPVKVKTAAFALHDIFDYRFTAVSPKQAQQLRKGLDFRAGTGAALTLKPAQAASGGYVRYAEIDLPRKNTYDLDLSGGRADGAQGETVEVGVRLSNYGPAWIGALRSGGEPFTFLVNVPEGAKVTKSPASCNPMNTGDGKDESQYLCWANTPILETDKRDYPFEFLVEKVVAGAKARIHFPEFPGQEDSPWEGNPANDDGWIVLNGTGDEETPGDTGGSGSTGGSTGGSGSTEGTTGGSSTGGSTGGSGDDGSTGGSSTGSTGGTSAQGGLASTGSTALLAAGGAAVALAAGGVLFVAARRRRSV